MSTLFEALARRGYFESSRDLDPTPQRNVPYFDLDPEMVEVVELLNQVPGIVTTCCCFGHPEEPSKVGNNHNFLFVDLECKDGDKFIDFWTYVLKYTYAGLGKMSISPHHESGFQIGLEFPLNLCQFNQHRVRLHISPSTIANARLEKLVGLWFLCTLIRHYLRNYNPTAAEIGILPGGIPRLAPEVIEPLKAL